jgi:hypothetical protein
MENDLEFPCFSRNVTKCMSQASFSMPMHLLQSAWHEHSPFASWLIEAIQPDCFVELGTHTGFSYLAFCQAVQRLKLKTSCYAIDTWIGDDHAGFYGEEVFANLAGINERTYAGFSHLIRSLFDEALPYFSDGSIDLLHIDGRHAYEDVRHDFESWRPKLSDRGIVLFHDTKVRERGFGVWRLWRDLAAEHPSFEFHHGHGLGVLAPGLTVPQGLRSLFTSNLSQRARIRSGYSRLGAAVHRQYDLQGLRDRTAGFEESSKTAATARAEATEVALSTAVTGAEPAQQARSEAKISHSEQQPGTRVAKAEWARLSSMGTAAVADGRRAAATSTEVQAPMLATSNERDLLLSSMIRRATWPLLRAGASLPKPVRRAIRRLLRAAVADPSGQLLMIKPLRAEGQ